MKHAKHLDFIRQLPCLICEDNTTVEACHVKFADGRIAKLNSAQRKDDTIVLPMCGKHHRAQHAISERGFWAGHGIDAVLTGLALYAASGDYQRGIDILKAARGK